ncbi:MAG: HAMP domain-containing protein [Sphingobacteriia bacterium]|nr:MAG: HAMP domain-containing protein [Sphingobacteriia bacterium]
MMIKLKTKIALGVAFLFSLLILVGSICFYYLNQTIDNQKIILKDNYETLEYTQQMLQALDEWGNDTIKSQKIFEKNLKNQEANITEQGELEATKTLTKHYTDIKDWRKESGKIVQVRNDINRIMQINLQAIIRKNSRVQTNADEAKFWITLLLTICILAGFTFVFNFPGFIANPIAKLTDGIKAISNKRYEQRIHLNRKDEFGEMANAFNTMAEELDKYEHSNLAKILFEKKRAETVINSLRDASIGIDSNGLVLFANQQALALLHLKEAEIIGKKQVDIAKQNDLFRYLQSEETNQPFKIVVDNKESFYTKETVEIKNEDGQHIASVIILKNITPFKELDVAKTNFIATISHELKTPLSSSDFSLKLLEDERIGTLNEEQKELVKNLKSDNQRLLKIISELLDLSQVESGKIQLNIEAVAADAIVQKAVEAVANNAQQKNIQLIQAVSTNLPLVKADVEKTSWILVNLLTNAIKYTPENESIYIDVKENNNELIFSVTDTGNGIPAEYLVKLFDRFYQVPGTANKGTGLGLSISKEFMEAQAGTISVESELGKGSRFYFNLPKAN